MTTTPRSSYTLLQRLVWRWHFYAGLMVIPFAIFLAVSGSIYLFKPQYESWVESQINGSNEQLSSTHTALPAEQLIQQLSSQYPQAVFKKWIMAKAHDRSIEMEWLIDDAVYVFWLDQYSGEVLHKTKKTDRLMHVVKKLHSELLSGNIGSYVVELMASWMIVLLVTGLFLWFPRSGSIKQLVTPSQWRFQGRKSWREWHGIIGSCLGLLILIFLLSGLPWTQLWGGGFKQLQTIMGWNGPGQEWQVTLTSQSASTSTAKSDGLDMWQTREEVDEHIHEPASLTSKPRFILSSDDNNKPISLQQIISLVAAYHLHHPIEISPPKSDNGVWTVRSMTPNRPLRETVHFDRWSGDEIMHIRFDDYHAVKQVVAFGIAFHEGALFGLANQLIGVITASAIIFLSISGLLMWWIRRPKGQLAAPSRPKHARVSAGTIFIIMLLAAFLPMFALSLVLIVMFDVVLNASRRKH